MSTDAVYIVRTSQRTGDPELDPSDPRNREGLDRMYPAVEEGVAAERLQPIHLFTDTGNAAALDIHDFAGSLIFGFFSARAMKLLSPIISLRFDMLPATIDNEPYSFLRLRDALDCLDRSRAGVKYSRSNPSLVDEVTKYAFRKDAIPEMCLFTTPEEPVFLFATGGVKGMMESAALRGFRFTDGETWRPGR
jgi:hypothetical protein